MPDSTFRREYNYGMRTVVILILLACVAYGNSLHAPFVFDDIVSVQHNQHVRLGDYFTYDPSLYLRPRSLLFVTFALNDWIGGQNVFGYHLVNLILHLLNGLLVFAIAVRIFPQAGPARSGLARSYALLAAAFFIVHPVGTEAVTYISSRSDLLSTFAYLCGLLVFMIITAEGKVGFLASLPVLFFLIVGFGFKETVVTLPASLFVYDYLFIAKSDVRRMFAQWRFYLSFLIPPAIALVVLAARADVLKSWQGQVNTLLTSGGLRPWPYLLTESRVILRYLRLIAIPSGLNLDYDFPPAASIIEPGVLLSILLIAGLVAVAWTRRRTEPVFSFSIFWFFITLSVTSSILPIPDVITERRLYLPLAGVCLLFPLALEWLVKSATGAIHSRVVMRVAAVLLGVLMIGTIFRNNVWSDEVRLFSDTVAKSPHKLRPYENLILAHMKRGEEEQAITVAKAGIENVPSQRISLLDTLGTLYLRLGRPQDAVESFKSSNEEAVRAGAGSAFVETSFNNLGSAYLALAGKGGGQNPKTREEALRNARQAFQKSLEQVPGNVSALDGVVNATLGLGESGAMQQELRRRLEASPNEFSALYMLASLLSWEQHYPESIEYFRRAAAAQQTNSDMLYFNYAFALSKIGQIEPAIQGYKEALRQDPTFNEAHYNLALLYIQKGDYASAVEHLTDIVNAEAGNVRANMKLAEIYAYQQKLPLARRHLHQVLKANPQDREALSLFAKIGE